MKKIGITGINGFLGWHLRVFLHNNPDVQVIGADRKTFAEHKKLLNFVRSCDVIVHFAGMNRGDDQEMMSTNIRLTDDLIAACESTKSKPHIIFPSSTQVFLGTPYGNSKKICMERLGEWAARSGGVFTNIILPNVFGECGKPFYNSVIATFCYQIANELKPEIIQDNNIELIHAQAVARRIYNIASASSVEIIRFTGIPIMVSDVLVKLSDLSDKYRKGVFPDVTDDLDLRLFNTLISYFYPKHYPVALNLFQDDRGKLFEAVKSSSGGKCFISNTNPGFTRGNHYHTKTFERFLVVEGRATVCVRKLFSEDVVKFEVDGKNPQYIDIPTMHTHNITNTGNKDLITVFWSSRVDDNDDGHDVFSEPVEVKNAKS